MKKFLFLTIIIMLFCAIASSYSYEKKGDSIILNSYGTVPYPNDCYDYFWLMVGLSDNVETEIEIKSDYLNAIFDKREECYDTLLRVVYITSFHSFNDQTIRLLKYLIASRPNKPGAWYYLGKYYKSLIDNENTYPKDTLCSWAEVCYFRALEKKYKHIESIYIDLSELYNLNHKYSLGEEYAKKATSINRLNPLAYSALAISYFNMSDYNNAEQAILEAIKYDVNYTEFFEQENFQRRMVEIFNQSNKITESIQNLEAFIQQYPQSSLNNLLMSLYSQNNLEERGALFFEKMLKKEPKNVNFMNYFANCLLRLNKDLPKVSSLLSKALKIEPQNEHTILLQGCYYLYINKKEMANSCLSKLLEINSDLAVTLKNIIDNYKLPVLGAVNYVYYCQNNGIIDESCTDKIDINFLNNSQKKITSITFKLTISGNSISKYQKKHSISVNIDTGEQLSYRVQLFNKVSAYGISNATNLNYSVEIISYK